MPCHRWQLNSLYSNIGPVFQKILNNNVFTCIKKWNETICGVPLETLQQNKVGSRWQNVGNKAEQMAWQEFTAVLYICLHASTKRGHTLHNWLYSLFAFCSLGSNLGDLEKAPCSWLQLSQDYLVQSTVIEPADGVSLSVCPMLCNDDSLKKYNFFKSL